jgi:L-threonylcarbamoyladenylate synthase
MKIIFPRNDYTKEVLDLFAQNQPVALPTETVYGLAAPIDRPEALARIFEIKNRPSFNPLIVHIKKEWDLNAWVEAPNTVQQKLIDSFWPGPLSILFKKKNISDLVTAGSEFVILRAPKHKVFQEVLEALKVPLAAPSANESTSLSPTSAQAVVEGLTHRNLHAVVDGAACESGLESTIVQVLENSKLFILREGGISKEDLAAKGFEICEPTQKTNIQSPGTSLKHYAPKVPLYFFEEANAWANHKGQAGSLFLKVLESDGNFCVPETTQTVNSLSRDSLLEAASKLFEFLRQAQKSYKEIYVLKTQDLSLGRAINDRLKRAAHASLKED